MKRSWSCSNCGSGFSNANTGPGAQHNNNAAGPQYNYNYYGSPYSGTDQERERPKCEKQECLQSLSFSNIDARRQDIVLAHPNTGDWIFDTTEFRQWRDRTDLSKHNGVLWIKGHPGTGKSTLMKHIWRHCQRELQDRTIATYFFHARGESLEKTPLGMLRSLVCQLVDNEEPTCQRLFPLFHQKNRLHQKWEWRESELKEFLLSEMQVRERPPLVILIDALDECGDSQVRDVVKFLEQLSITCLRSGAKVWICLSSRHYPHITIAKYQEFVVETRTGHDTDIATYVHDNLTKSNPDIEKEVLKKASGIFMWVVLVVAMLNKAYDEGKIEAMEQKLREVPSDLDELFSSILSKGNPDKHETIFMLQWVLFAVRPLAPEDLYYATLAGTGVTNLGPWDQSQLTADDIQRRITYSSKGLIEVLKAHGNHRVQFIHESVKDFLLRNQRLQSLDPTLESNPIGQSHDRLKDCCVSFIRINASIPDDISMDDIRLKYPFLTYASSHWLDHAEAAQAGNVSQVEFLMGILWGIKEDHGVERLLRLHMSFCLYEDTLRISANEDDVNEDDLLLMSLVHEHNSVARILLEHGADISPQGWDYDGALHAAACYGSKEMVKLLITYDADPNDCYRWGTPLHDAISYRNEETVVALLEHGADVNATGGEYGTALQEVAWSGNDEFAKLLLEHGADVNAQGDGEYGTALQAAAALNYENDRAKAKGDVVRLLLEHGAEVNAQGGKYGTALQAASLSGYGEIAKLLLDHGAEVNATGGEYGTALQAAAGSPYYDNGDRGTEMRNITKMLLDNGADVNAQGGKYGTALQAAISKGRQDIETLLREHGATE